jgi:predicted flap endonuclease-1-like 5' DNA nuclease
MRTVQNPARRIAWLIILLGAVALVGGLLWRALNPESPGISLPFTRTVFDAGWLIWAGLGWLVVGGLLRGSLNAMPGKSAQEANTRVTIDTAIREARAAADLRLNDLDARVRSLDSTDRLTLLEQRLTDLEAARAARPLDTRSSDLDERFHDLNGRLVALNSRIDGLGHVQGRLDGHDRSLTDVDTRLQAVQARLDQLVDPLPRLNLLDQRVSDHTDHLNRSDTLFTQNNTRINDLKAELGVMDAEIQGLSARLTSIQEQTHHTQQRLDRLAVPARFAAVDAHLNANHDLKMIEGIGPKIEQALHTAGLLRFEDVAGATLERLRAAIEASGIRFAPSITTWSRQAQYLAANDLIGLKTYQDQLIAGREA